MGGRLPTREQRRSGNKGVVMRETSSARRIILVTVTLAVVLIGFASHTEAQDSTGLEGTVEGVLTLTWGDGPPEEPQSVGPFPMLTDDLGRTVLLLLEDELVAQLGGLLAVNGRRVVVHGSWASFPAASSSLATLAVDSIEFPEGAAPAAITAVSGSQPWVSIMCKFADVSAEPKNLVFFQNMFSSSYPGLDHYWREVSYNNVNIEGSDAYGWYTLPHPQSYYVVTDPNNPMELSYLFADCVAAADADVYFPDFVGINLMLNDTFGSWAWGGGRTAVLDGMYKTWRVTWEPPWGYRNITVMSHEMGHGFGLPHSCWDPGATYDNSWDVMSNAWAPSVVDPVYGRVGQHTITHHKDTILGWLRTPERVDVGSGGSTTVRLERLALPDSPGPKMVKVPIAGSSTKFYTVEGRRRTGYDLGLPGEAVIIHQVETTRNIDAYVQGTNGGTGAMWTLGELFLDAANDIGIAVTGTAGAGFEVAVASGSTMAASYPQIDSRAASGTSSNVNGIFEPAETIVFDPAWTNVSTGTVSSNGSLSAFSGPGGASYTIIDGVANYGSVASVGTSSCRDNWNCYRLTVSDPASRPLLHWDATVVESLSSGATKTWTLHIGSSFSDVNETNWAYPYIETIFHHGITTGWTAEDYAPLLVVKRWHMATFLARALTGSSIFPTSGTVPGKGNYNCTASGTSVFSDVGPGTSMCKAVHYIASRQVTLGCGGTNFCPYNNVSRWQMALFLARAMTGRTSFPVSGTVSGMGDFNCVDGGQSVFSDLNPAHSSCSAVHFLATEGVTVGCRPGEYCPWNGVTRAQMATFLTRAFGLGLYQP